MKLLTLQLDDATGGKDVRVGDAADMENTVTTDMANLVSAAADVRTYYLSITLEVGFCNKRYLQRNILI